MNAPLFPVITGTIARRSLEIARTDRNSVQERIHAAMSAKMRVVCAWCKRSLGTVQCTPAHAGKVSHGICEPCAKTHFTNLVGDAHPACQKATDVCPFVANKMGENFASINPGREGSAEQVRASEVA